MSEEGCPCGLGRTSGTNGGYRANTVQFERTFRLWLPITGGGWSSAGQLPGLSYPHCPSLTLSPSSSSTRSPCSCLRPSHHLSFSMLFAWVSACFPPALCSAHFLTEAFSDLLTDHFDFLLLAGLPSLSTSSMGQGLVCLPHRCQGERGTPWALALHI